MNASKRPLCIVALSALLLAPRCANADVWVAADGALAKVAADGRILLTMDSVFGRSFSYCAGPDNIIAVDQRSGHVWIADINNNRLIELNAGGQPLREIAVVSPTALAIAPDSSAIWAAILLDQRPAVIKVDPSSGETRVRVTGFANSVFALGVGPSGRVWIGDRFNNEVVILSGTDDQLDGSDVSAAVGPHHLRVGGFDEILDLAVAPTDDPASQESSWVADRGHAEAVKIGADGTELVRVHPTSFFEMNFVSVDRGDGSAWVADPNSSRLAKLTPLGDETLNQPVAFPTALAVDTADNAVWLGTGFFDEARLRKLDPNGTELLAVGGAAG